jgi:hypothetical protein
VINSSRGGKASDAEDARRFEAALFAVQNQLDQVGVKHEVRQIVRGNDPPQDLIELAEAVHAEFIVIGLRKRAPLGKVFLDPTPSASCSKPPVRCSPSRLASRADTRHRAPLTRHTRVLTRHTRVLWASGSDAPRGSCGSVGASGHLVTDTRTLKARLIPPVGGRGRVGGSSPSQTMTGVSSSLRVSFGGVCPYKVRLRSSSTGCVGCRAVGLRERGMESRWAAAR